MCGIAGIIQTNKHYTTDHLKKMTAAIAHRGPDGEQYWQNTSGSVLFGHRHLSIIDLSPSAMQPMHHRERYTIIHNGEVYNYIEIREELKQKGYNFISNSDTEVIVAAYDEWKDECVDRFDGMFAFAIWDELEKKLFAARDRFGEKPLFFHQHEGVLLFASEMKALWAAGIPRTPNRRMLFNYITIGYTDNPEQPGETFFETIFKLPPATTLTYTACDNNLILEKYWDIDTEYQQKISDHDALDKFGSLLDLSVKRRLRSEVPIGALMSGGLDSSSIMASVKEAEILSYPPEALTAIFPGFAKDESEYSKQVSDHFNLRQTVIPVSHEDLINGWDTFCFHQEEPVGSASAFAQFKVYERAKQKNIKVLLDGQGADESLAGYSKYYKWYWQELFRKRKLYRSGELSAAKELGVNEKFGLTNMVAAYFPDVATVMLERQYLLRALKQEDLQHDFVRLQSREAYYTTPEYFTLNGALHFNTCVHGLEELLRYADRNSMAHGTEVRLPFLSHELVEFIFSLPGNFKIRQGWTKWILRETMKDKLPADITWRKNKVGFEPPQKVWMQTKEMGEMIRESRQTLIEEGILKPGVIDKPILALDSHAADNFDWRYLSAARLFL